MSTRSQFSFALLATAAVLAFVIPAGAAVRAFPGAEGAGAYSRGGRGGDVYHVTNLSDEDGTGAAIPGSLRYGIKFANGPRTIVFDVGGMIELSGSLKLDKTNMTIAGQTAPGDGIGVKNYPMNMEANDLIMRYFHLRTGYGSYNASNANDCLQITSGTNMIADHISASFGGDETISATHQPWNLTVQWCLISDSLNFQNHGYGSLIAPELSGTRISWHHNLYSNNDGRTPRVGSRLFATNFVFDYINNVNYNWGTAGDWGCWGVVGGNPNEETVDINFINNYSIAGANTSTTTARNAALSSNFDTSRIYQSGNLIDSDRNTVRNGVNTGWAMFRGTYIQMASPFPIDPANAIATTDANTAYLNVLYKVGASLARDSADLRAVNYVRYQTGSIINLPTQVGGFPTLNSAPAPKDTDGDGMPDYWEMAVGLNPNVADGNLDRNSDGYTELEDYLNWLAAPHATCNLNGSVNVDLRKFNGGSDTNLSFTVADGTNGTVTLLGDGYTALFSASANLTGLASFTFSGTDVATGTNLGLATVSVVITASNTPPIVDAQPDRTITAGSTLSTTFGATDNDQPPQTLLFSIPNLPAGASFNATNRTLTWRPAMTQSGTNILAIIVTDSGSPSLSATRNYTVIVNRPASPGFQSWGMTNGRFSLVITGVHNPDYRIQASTNLADSTNWLTLFTTNIPLLPVRWTDSNASSFATRFYRVQLLP
jgi:pectate lyase